MGCVILSGAGRRMALSTPISDLSVGSVVKIKVNGVATDFLIANQGIPSNSNLYDASCDGTWLLMKDIYENRQWNSSNVNNLENSTVLGYLNGPFLNLFDSSIRNMIKQVKIPYRRNGGSGGTDQSSANGLLCKIFLLSGYEVGLTTSNYRYFPVDGAKLSYFKSGTDSSALNKRIAYLNGSAARWWWRSPRTDDTELVWGTTPNGSFGQAYTSDPSGIRPALILPSTTLVDSNGMVIAPPVEYKANFAENDWATIIDACHNNKVPDTWVVGNQKTMTINGTDYAIDIIGKNHDDYADGSGKAPLTFQLHDCYESATAMNSSGYNTGGWTKCDIRQNVLPTIISLMPEDVQSGIREINKLTSAGGTSKTINTTADKLFLLSEIEVFGALTNSVAGEGMQYNYYKTNNSKIKMRNGAVDDWWLRSPDKRVTTIYAKVSNAGKIDMATAGNSNAVSFGFCF